MNTRARARVLSHYERRYETTRSKRAGSPPRVSCVFFFFSSRRRHTRYIGDWSSDVCSSDLGYPLEAPATRFHTSAFSAKGFTDVANVFRNGCAAIQPSDRVGSAHGGGAARGSKIGRASCRERVRGWEGADVESWTDNRHQYQ